MDPAARAPVAAGGVDRIGRNFAYRRRHDRQDQQLRNRLILFYSQRCVRRVGNFNPDFALIPCVDNAGA